MAGSDSRIEQILRDLEHFGVKLGLDRMRRVLEELGSPQKELPVVLVAGTNGKGSVAAWLASVVSAAGYRSGLYTSPHLERVEERLRIDGRSIESGRLEALLVEVLDASNRAIRNGAATNGAATNEASTNEPATNEPATNEPASEMVTYFEALTAAALLHFRDERVDLAVMEVGLGGRLDATNVTEPLMSLVTEIALDHQRQLGDTVERIAVEKAGIFRCGCRALSSATAPEAVRALREAARRCGANLELSADLVRLVSARESAPGADGSPARVEMASAKASYHLAPRLRGEHQLWNLALAVAASEQLAASGFEAIDVAAVERGVAACEWPGRLEWIRLESGPPGTGSPGTGSPESGSRGSGSRRSGSRRSGPREAGAEVLLDAAHNPAGLEALSAYLGRLDRPFVLVFGMLREKVDPAVVRRLWEMPSATIVTRPRSDRALPAAELVRLVGVTPTEQMEAPTEAMEAALALGSPVVVCGSLYLVGEVRAWLRRTWGSPPPDRGLFDREGWAR